MVLWGVGASAQTRPPRKVFDVKPEYPAESLRLGDEGVVLLELKVLATGSVDTARVLWSGCKRLDAAALAAARGRRYEQVFVNGESVPFAVVAEVPFRLPASHRGRNQLGACKWRDAPKPLMTAPRSGRKVRVPPHPCTDYLHAVIPYATPLGRVAAALRTRLAGAQAGPPAGAAWRESHRIRPLAPLPLGTPLGQH